MQRVRLIPLIIVAVIAAVIITAILIHPALIFSKEVNASAVLNAVPDWAMEFGDRSAPITVVELYDPLCPYCVKVHYELGRELEDFVARGRLRLILIPFPIHGNESMIIINALHCAYIKNGTEALRLLNEWYNAIVKLALNGTRSELDAVAMRLSKYNCNQTLTIDQIKATLNALRSAGVDVLGTPTFIIIKGGRGIEILGARTDDVRKLLT